MRYKKYKYNKQNNLIEKNHYSSSGVLESQNVIKYNNSNNIIEEKLYTYTTVLNDRQKIFLNHPIKN